MSWQDDVDELNRRQAMAREMGGADSVAFQHGRGKLTVRERIDLLADAGSFQEIGAFVAKVEQSSESDTYTLTGVLGRATTDQGAQSIHANYQMFFNGDAADALGTTPAHTWSLPDPTA